MAAPREQPAGFQQVQLDYLVCKLVDESDDPLDTCIARIDRASAAGLAAYNKLTGASRKIPKVPSLAKSCGCCSQPRASGKYYYPVLRTAGWQPGSVYTSWSEAILIVGSPPLPGSIFTEFHFKAEVEVYFRSARALRLLPLDW